MERFADLARSPQDDVSTLFSEHVALWHESATTDLLHEWLGLTEAEYAAIVEKPP